MPNRGRRGKRGVDRRAHSPSPLIGRSGRANHPAARNMPLPMRKKVSVRGPRMSIRAATLRDRIEWARMRRALWPDCKGPRAALEMREQLSDPKKFGVLVIDRGDGTLCGF